MENILGLVALACGLIVGLRRCTALLSVSRWWVASYLESSARQPELINETANQDVHLGRSDRRLLSWSVWLSPCCSHLPTPSLRPCWPTCPS